MSLRSVVFTILTVSVIADAAPRTVAVNVVHSDVLSSLTANAFDRELKRLLSPAGIELTIVMDSATGGVREVSDRSIQGAFKGNCTTDMLQLQRIAPESPKVLGSAPVFNDRVLPSFTVDCDRIGQMLQPTLQLLTVPFRSALLGRAMARVAAHELYHILAQTTEHDTSGIAQSQLSLENLLDDDFKLSPTSLQRMNGVRADTVAVGPHPGFVSLEGIAR